MDNRIANILKGTGIATIIIGFVAGIIWAAISSDLGWAIAFTCWIYAFISGILFIGFAEVIDLLNTQNESLLRESNTNRIIIDELKALNSHFTTNLIFNNDTDQKYDIGSTGENKQTDSKETKIEEQTVSKTIADLELEDIKKEEFEKIKKHFFSFKKIQRITYTPFEHIYLVIYLSSVELVYYRGFIPSKLDESKINEIEGLNNWYENIYEKVKHLKPM